MTKKQNSTTSTKTNSDKKFFDIIVWETREKGDKKHIPHKVGYGVQLDNGNLSCKLVDGITLSGKFSISPQQYKA